VGPLVEQQVLQALHGFVEPLHGGEVAVDDEVEQPPEQKPTPCRARSVEPSQRSITPWMSKPGSLRTVMSARGWRRRPARWW
jgi:hypothetical protein